MAHVRNLWRLLREQFGVIGLALVAAVVVYTIANSAGPNSSANNSALPISIINNPPVQGITVIGRGVATAPPDFAQVQIAVHSVSTTAPNALDQVRARMAAITNTLKTAGVSVTDIRVVDAGAYPQPYSSGGDPGGLAGYQVTGTLQVTIRNLGAIALIFSQAHAAGATSIGYLSFGTNDPAALQALARGEALANAQAQADDLAAQAGVQRGAILAIGQVLPPTPSPAPPGNAAGLAAGSEQVQAQVELQVTYAIQ